MKKHHLPCSLLALGAVLCLASCATSSTAKLDTKTDAVLSAMSEKLAGAKTVRASVKRTASPGFHTGLAVAESATGNVVVQRPNKLAAHMKTSDGKRSLGFDGTELIVVDHAAGTHAIVSATGDIDQAVRGIQKTYGITPPVGELLVNQPKALLLDGVKTGTCIGTESIGGVECDQLSFVQDGLTWQLWVATRDKLPRKILLTYPNNEGGDPLTMTATMSKWELDTAVSDADLTVSAPAGSRAIDMIPLSN